MTHSGLAFGGARTMVSGVAAQTAASAGRYQTRLMDMQRSAYVRGVQAKAAVTKQSAATARYYQAQFLDMQRYAYLQAVQSTTGVRASVHSTASRTARWAATFTGVMLPSVGHTRELSVGPEDGSILNYLYLSGVDFVGTHPIMSAILGIGVGYMTVFGVAVVGSIVAWRVRNWWVGDKPPAKAVGGITQDSQGDPKADQRVVLIDPTPLGSGPLIGDSHPSPASVSISTSASEA